MGILRIVAAVTLLIAGTSAALDADEVQRCVQSCQSNSGPAGSPQYDRCVQQNCSGLKKPNRRTGSSKVVPGTWKMSVLERDKPPYLDGRTASITSADGRATMTYVCGRGGDSYLFLGGRVIDRMRLRTEQSVRASIQIDHAPPYTLKFGEYEGALTHSMPPKSEVLAHFRNGTTVTVTIPRYRGRFSLRGSSDALSAALRYCQT